MGMKCPKCGLIQMARTTCKACGATLTSPAPLPSRDSITRRAESDKEKAVGSSPRKSFGWRGWLGIAFVGMLVLGVVGNFLSKEKEKVFTIRKSGIYKDETAVGNFLSKEKIVMPNYRVLDQRVYDVPAKTEVGQILLVWGEISGPGLRALLNELYSSIKAMKGFKYHDSPTLIYIEAYTSEERAKSDMGLTVAVLKKSPYDAEPIIGINEEQIAQLGAKPEERFGLSEQARQEIWKEFVSAENRVQKEIEEQYPRDPTQSLRVGQVLELSKGTPLMPELEPADPIAALQRMRSLPSLTTIEVRKTAMKGPILYYFVEATSPSKTPLGSGWINSIALMGQEQVAEHGSRQWEKRFEIQSRLRDKYKEELGKKYGLTREQLKEISIEGQEKYWPSSK